MNIENLCLKHNVQKNHIHNALLTVEQYACGNTIVPIYKDRATPLRRMKYELPFGRVKEAESLSLFFGYA